MSKLLKFKNMKNNKTILFTILSVALLACLIGLHQVSAADNTSTLIQNPLGNNNTLDQVLNIVLLGIQAIVGVISVIFIILAGLQFVLAGGDTAKIKKARDMLLYVVIGVAILFGAQGIYTVVKSTITQVTSGSTTGN